MTIIEHMKNIFAPVGNMPHDFVRNPEYDLVFMHNIFERLPELIRARNGRTYIYFDTDDAGLLEVVRKMGFKPRMHRSHKYLPAKIIYRAPISRDMPKSAKDIVSLLLKLNGENFYVFLQNIESYKSIDAYNKYIAEYKLKLKENTK